MLNFPLLFCLVTLSIASSTPFNTTQTSSTNQTESTSSQTSSSYVAGDSSLAFLIGGLVIAFCALLQIFGLAFYCIRRSRMMHADPESEAELEAQIEAEMQEQERKVAKKQMKKTRQGSKELKWEEV